MTIDYEFNVRLNREEIEDFVNRKLKEKYPNIFKIAYFENYGKDYEYNFNIFTIDNGRIVNNQFVSIIDFIRENFFENMDVDIIPDTTDIESGEFKITITDFYEEDFEAIARFSNEICDDSNDDKDINDCIEGMDD